ncbi:uncharacterized protein [Ptychodera flava]|uniref:uncharacterized protein n=1 Tax=Ptychodera flava TaxID=63121 RepID=UPI00396A531A
MAETGSGNNQTNGRLSPGLERQSTRAPVEKKISARSGNGSQPGSVRMKLKKVDEYEAKDAQMSAVFGVAPREVKNTLKVNPLYDQYGQGVIEVSEMDAQTAKNTKSSKMSRGSIDRSHRFSRTDPDDTEPKISYGSNFMYGRSKEPQNGAVPNGNDNKNKQITAQGRVMPSRITRSSKLKNQPKSSGQAGRSKDSEAGAPERSKVRRWRLIMLLVLIVLILALALVLAIYFLTRGT